MSHPDNIKACIRELDDQAARALLPTYSELVEALRQATGINPFGSVENAAARDAARDLLARIPD